MKTVVPVGRVLALLPAFAKQGSDKININGELVLAARTGHTARVAALLPDGAAVNSRKPASRCGKPRLPILKKATAKPCRQRWSKARC